MPRKKADTKAKKAKKAYEKAKKTSKPGQGKRFKKLAALLEAQGAENPDALAAYIGRKKYGKKMQQWAAKGRKKKEK